MAQPSSPRDSDATGSGITRSVSLTASVSSSRSDNALVREQQRSVEHAEHLGDLRRFRAGVLVSVPTWCACGILDWIVATWTADGASTLIWFWSVRWGIMPLVAFVAWGAFKKPTASPTLLRGLDSVLYTSAAYAIALMTIRYNGITSAYLAGIMMVVVARNAFFAQRWTRALAPNLLIASSFPIVLGIGSFFVPAIRAQLSDPVALGMATQYLFFIYGTMVLMVAATHYAWTIRRQLFESRSIGRYRLKHRIGAGGMGEVWAAFHPGLKRDVALKILRAEAATDEIAVARFEREVKATSDLSHPNTIRVFDFGVTDDGVFYYAMELLEGLTLAELVKTEGPLAPARAVHLVVQAARALAEAHDRGIVHRDVKPANIFVTNAGGQSDFVKVLDFGIAKRVADAQTEIEATLTGTGLLAGTPKYMAPELVLGKQATPRSDVYGIGGVLYCLLTGRAPFEGVTATAIYAAQVIEEVTPPSIVRGEPIAPELEHIVARCLAKEPTERFADARELADALDALDLRWRPHRFPTAAPPPPATRASAPPGLQDPDTPTVLQRTVKK